MEEKRTSPWPLRYGLLENLWITTIIVAIPVILRIIIAIVGGTFDQIIVDPSFIVWFPATILSYKAVRSITSELVSFLELDDSSINNTSTTKKELDSLFISDNTKKPLTSLSQLFRDPKDFEAYRLDIINILTKREKKWTYWPAVSLIGLIIYTILHLLWTPPTNDLMVIDAIIQGFLVIVGLTLLQVGMVFFWSTVVSLNSIYEQKLKLKIFENDVVLSSLPHRQFFFRLQKIAGAIYTGTLFLIPMSMLVVVGFLSPALDPTIVLSTRFINGLAVAITIVCIFWWPFTWQMGIHNLMEEAKDWCLTRAFGEIDNATSLITNGTETEKNLNIYKHLLSEVKLIESRNTWPLNAKVMLVYLLTYTAAFFAPLLPYFLEIAN